LLDSNENGGVIGMNVIKFAVILLFVTVEDGFKVGVACDESGA